VNLFRRIWQPALVAVGVITVFWKLTLTRQYTFLDNPDLANMVVPRLEPVIYAIRHGSLLLWNPYEYFGQPSIGQVQPGVTSPFTFLLALAPLHNGHVQFFYIQLWFVLIHCMAGVFAWLLFRDLNCSAGPAVIGGILYATMGYYGNTDWPNNLQPAIMAPLVFLFLLRSLRGRAPLKSGAWSGVMLGISWLCGHHDPPVMMSYAVAAIGIAAAIPRATRRQAILRIAVLFVAMAAVAAVQILPALEYGKLSVRWTDTGSKTWNDRVQFPEHEHQSLKPADLIHLVLPGGGGIYSDPFTGTVALSLAAIALWSGFRRRKEVRLFTALAIGSLLWAMAGSDVLYGPLYALGPMIEKTREPVVALFLFAFAIAALAAIGAEILISNPEPARESRIAGILVRAGIAALVLALALRIDTDNRPAMAAFIALLLAGVYQVWSRQLVSRRSALVLLGLLVTIEQGSEVGSGWAQIHDPHRMDLINALPDTQDLADFLNMQPNPKRLEKNDKDVAFNFGDWNRIDSSNAYGASMLAQTNILGGWSFERISRMYGENYRLSRTPDRPGLQEVFTGRSGIKIWYDPGAFPRAWTVHRVIVAPIEWNAAGQLSSGSFDIRTTAVSTQSIPNLATCDAPDKVTAIDDQPTSVFVKVDMACSGLLIVSDNYYPGWKAELDGNSVDIRKVNTALRGVIVPAGRHTVTMNYRPLSVYFGFLLTLTGLAGAIVLQRRNESDGPALLPAQGE
jgi:hypothetical protein